MTPWSTTRSPPSASPGARWLSQTSTTASTLQRVLRPSRRPRPGGRRRPRPRRLPPQRDVPRAHGPPPLPRRLQRFPRLSQGPRPGGRHGRAASRHDKLFRAVRVVDKDLRAAAAGWEKNRPPTTPLAAEDK
ncbi:hypothetical protein VPH35_051574 [Triticum aestivum]